ncbi:MAG: BtaA family protein [Rhodocyclaceae bacterium]|nr:BtaA family protein [Rhodocyclaceae bacterium]
MNAPHPQPLTLLDRFDQKVFDAIYSRSLVYNTCWEDPAVDRKALELGADDTLLVITSAGCNVLDYALLGPKRIHAVDANPRQTALLELKLAAIRRLDYEDFFAFFGRGYHEASAQLYHDVLRAELSPFAREWWDERHRWFSSPHGSFYFHGLAGIVARGFRTYLKLRPALAAAVRELLAAPDVATQRRIYDRSIAGEFWKRSVNWVLSRQITMSLLGVPHPQRRLVQEQHPGGVAAFVRDAIEYVFRELSVRDNYFWRVYVTGHYTRDCCPEYLKRDNFHALKMGLADRIVPHTCTISEFLEDSDEAISRFVLLDHMDWMSSYYPAALIEEWNLLLRRAAPGARFLFRSAHARPGFLDWIRVGAQRRPLREVLHFHDELAARLQREDRVHTYAGFLIADVRP